MIDLQIYSFEISAVMFSTTYAIFFAALAMSSEERSLCVTSLTAAESRGKAQTPTAESRSDRRSSSVTYYVRFFSTKSFLWQKNFTLESLEQSFAGVTHFVCSTTILVSVALSDAETYLLPRS